MANAGDPLIVQFEPSSMALISTLDGYQSLLAGVIGLTNPKAAQIVINTIPTVTNWQNGTDTLDYSFYVMQSSLYNLVFGSNLPYAHVRNGGFEGTDSLGRQRHDVGAHYIEKALDASENQVADLYEAAIQGFLDQQFGRYSA